MPLFCVNVTYMSVLVSATQVYQSANRTISKLSKITLCYNCPSVPTNVGASGYNYHYNTPGACSIRNCIGGTERIVKLCERGSHNIQKL